MFAQDHLLIGFSHKLYLIQCSINKALFTLLTKLRKQVDVLGSHNGERQGSTFVAGVPPAHALMVTHRQPSRVP